MNLHACQNCWFNGLQFGALGLPIGYCSRHKKILNFADATTCGMHVRKDLSISRAQRVANFHSKQYKNESIVRAIDRVEVEDDVSDAENDLDALQSDRVAAAVSDFGQLGSKIESLAQLNAMQTVRSEVAMVSLARGYVNNCVQRGGKWTSGLHLYWWTKNRLSEIPTIALGDLRTVGSAQLARQTTLISWSVMMLRLTFIDDVIVYADQANELIGREQGLLDRAAESVGNFNLNSLSKWLKKEAIAALDAKLTHRRYSDLAQELYRERKDAEAHQSMSRCTETRIASLA